MRYIMKGGVWKNSEDEILKAAIMKYGLNQWSRISSLLQRKSAKQCKQRWYQWLDPSIKKTQWSRAQDQKLLQLARVFPSQWRTIAPFVGRTPTQCFQRYQKLLDLAQGKTGQQTQDLKRLRPRQIDPNPQTKPARLDPIDMDQDEKQMLAEVRVRLANTKGKKAKRKQRQKIIQQARRLAQLQKIRQLQMAGVDNIPTAKQIKRMRQKQDIDYNKQIPFKRQIPQFVYKLQQNQTSKNTFFASTISLQTLQGKRRDVEQQLQRKLDKKRIKRLKDTDYKAMMNLKNKFQKPGSVPINLPEPQLNEKDLQDMKRYNITTPLNSILNNNQKTPFGMTPENKIMLSARINHSLNHRGIMTPIQQDYQDNQQQNRNNSKQDQIDGVDQLQYLKQIQKNQKNANLTNKNRSIDRIISQRIKTPLIQNQWEQNKNKIKSLFKNLRKPENIIQFQIPQQKQQEQNQQFKEQNIIDAEQLQKIQQQTTRKKQQQRLNLRSQVLKQNLQRIKAIPQRLTPTKQSLLSLTQHLIQKQLINMLYTDNIDYPVDSCLLPNNAQFTYLEPIPLTRRQDIIKLIDNQAKNGLYIEPDLQQSYKLGNFSQFHQQKYQKLYQKAHNYIQTKQSKITHILHIQSHTIEKQKLIKQYINFQKYKQFIKTNQNIQKKVKKYLSGYQKVIGNKIQELNALGSQLERLKMERMCLEVLGGVQVGAMEKRLSEEQEYYKIIYNAI